MKLGIMPTLFRFFHHPKYPIVRLAAVILSNLHIDSSIDAKQKIVSSGVLDKIVPALESLSSYSFILSPSPLDYASSKQSTATSHSLCVVLFCRALMHLVDSHYPEICEHFLSPNILSVFTHLLNTAFANSTLIQGRCATGELEASALEIMRVINNIIAELTIIPKNVDLLLTNSYVLQTVTVLENYAKLAKARKNGDAEDALFCSITTVFLNTAIYGSNSPAASGENRLHSRFLDINAIDGLLNVFATVSLVQALTAAAPLQSAAAAATAAVPDPASVAKAEKALGDLAVAVCYLHRHITPTPVEKFVHVLKKVKELVATGSANARIAWEGMSDAEKTLENALKRFN